LVKVVKSAKDHIVNKRLIGWHMLAYLLLFIAYIVELIDKRGDYHKIQVTNCVLLVINFGSSVILAMIVNEIRSKALQS